MSGCPLPSLALGVLLCLVACTGPEPDAAGLPAAPTGISAAAGESPVQVRVAWQPSEGATHYRVYRDGEEVAEVVGTVYEDGAASPGDLGEPEVSATEGVHSDRVVLSWSAVPASAPGPAHAYQVAAVSPAGEGPPSSEAEGHLGEAPVVAYEVTWDDATGWVDVGALTSFHDTGAPEGLVLPGQAHASLHTSVAAVHLFVLGATTEPGSDRSYRVRARSEAGAVGPAGEAVGHRGVGPLSYTWERSEDAVGPYAPLAGGTSEIFHDEGAPTDGTPRWYRAAVAAPGAATRRTDPVAGAVLSTGPAWPFLWGLHDDTQSNEDLDLSGQTISMGVDEAWAYTSGSDEVVIGIVDSGIDYHHPGLVDNLWVDPETGAHGIDTTAEPGTADALSPMDDVEVHGTHIAGIIGATNADGSGVVGVNREVRMVTCKAFDEHEFLGGVVTLVVASVQAAGQCLDYFLDLKEAGVNLVAVNHSYGSTRILRVGIFNFVTPEEFNYETADAGGGQTFREKLLDHADAGILHVFAAGNRGWDNDDDSDDGADVEYPASFRLPNLISVGALSPDGSLWRDEEGTLRTNHGAHTVDVFAPGQDILSTVPTVIPDNLADDFACNWGDDEDCHYMLGSGTSQAAPHVTGLAALIAAADPDLTMAEIRNLILSSGVPFQDPSLDGRTSVSGRYVLAAGEGGRGALSCYDQRLERRLAPRHHLLEGETGEVIELAYLHIDCAAPAGPVTATLASVPEGEHATTLALEDDGVVGDYLPGDGVYTAEWTVPDGDLTYEVLFHASVPAE